MPPPPLHWKLIQLEIYITGMLVNLHEIIYDVPQCCDAEYAFLL